jgi:hypothetical protein
MMSIRLTMRDAHGGYARFQAMDMPSYCARLSRRLSEEAGVPPALAHPVQAAAGVARDRQQCELDDLTC